MAVFVILLEKEATSFVFSTSLKSLRLRKPLDLSALAYWALLGPSWPYWALLGLTGPYWALLGLIGPYWALLGLTGPYWALLGLIGPYWALLGRSGPYWALLVVAATAQYLEKEGCQISN